MRVFRWSLVAPVPAERDTPPILVVAEDLPEAARRAVEHLPEWADRRTELVEVAAISVVLPPMREERVAPRDLARAWFEREHPERSWADVAPTRVKAYVDQAKKWLDAVRVAARGD